jgi:cysteinyl-tRNA synthetase
LPHLGHGRYTLVWDVARRWFTFQGLDVRYVSNITDIDDNIIARALRRIEHRGRRRGAVRAAVVGRDGLAR